MEADSHGPRPSTGNPLRPDRRPGAMFSYARAGRSPGVGRDFERGRPLAQRGTAREREGAFENAAITADGHYSLVTTHYPPRPAMI